MVYFTIEQKFLQLKKYNKLLVLGQTHYKYNNLKRLPVMIHRAKSRNNALDAVCGIVTI